MEEALYRDWDLLARIDLELVCRAAELNMALPDGDDTRSRQDRAKALEQIMQKTRPWPPSWDELVVRLYASRWLEAFIRCQPRCRFVRDSATRDAIVGGVKSRLVSVVIRNAGAWRQAWVREGRPSERSWQGFIRCQVPELTRRCADEETPPEEEITVGTPVIA